MSILEEMQMGYIFDCCAVLLVSGDIQDYVERRKDSFDILQTAGMGMGKDSTVHGCSFVHEGLFEGRERGLRTRDGAWWQ